MKKLEVKVSRETVTFEVGDCVRNSNNQVLPIVNFTNDGKIFLEGQAQKYLPHSLRFSDNTPENCVDNSLLTVLENEYKFQRAKTKSHELMRLFKLCNKRRKALQKMGLCPAAVKIQLANDFPLFYQG